MGAIAAISQFGFRNLANSVANIADGNSGTFWGFDNPSGLANNSWIQVDFGYPVKLKFFRLQKQAFGFGDFKVVLSNNPATNGSDAVGPDDFVTGVFRDIDTGSPPDPNYEGTINIFTGSTGAPQIEGIVVSPGQPNIGYYTMPLTTGLFRYMRLMPAGTLPISPGLLMSDISPDYSVAIKQVGFSSNDPVFNMVDGDFSTSYTPLASSFTSSAVLTSDPLTSNPGNLPFIQFDFGESVSLAALFLDVDKTSSGSNATWNPADKLNVNLTNNNLTATWPGNNFSGVRSTTSMSTGKFYVEFQNIAIASDFHSGANWIGFGQITTALGQQADAGTGGFMGVTQAGNFMRSGANTLAISGGAFGDPSGKTLSYAIDFDAGMIWGRLNNGNWNNSATADPATGVGGFNFRPNYPAGTQFFLQTTTTTVSVVNHVTLALSPSAFIETPPLGFDVWSGTNLAGDSLGDSHIIASNLDANDQAHAFMGLDALGQVIPDVDLGFVNGAALSSGVPIATGIDPSLKYRYYRLIFGKNDGPNGDKLVEFQFALNSSLRFIESDYDSVWGRGDRIANGMLATGVNGGLKGGTPTSAFNNNFSAAAGDHFSSDPGDLPAGANWWFHFGSWGVELHGLQWVSASGQAATVADIWQLQGGLRPGATFPGSYANEFNGLQWSQPNQFNLNLGKIEFTPKSPIPWPMYALVNSSHNASFPGGFMADELFIKIAHSNLDGGDRRNLSGMRSDKHVVITTSSGISPGSDLPYSGLLDGVYDYQNAGAAGPKGNYSHFQATSGGGAITNAGQWIQFTFPRSVTPNHLCFWTPNQLESYTVPGVPDHYGTWHWEFSDDNAHFTAIGDPWSFTENCHAMIAPRQQALNPLVPSTNQGFNLTAAGDTTGHVIWRMVLNSGPAFGSSPNLAQVVFNLTDRGNQGEFVSIDFSDGDVGDSFGFDISNFLPPGSPFAVALSDDVTDGLTATLTVTPGFFLRFDIDDGGDIEFFSNDILPSMVTQTVAIITGR